MAFRTDTTAASMTSPRTAIGVFHSRDKAEAAIAELRRNGFDADDLGFVSKRSDEWSDLATDKEVSDSAAAGTAGIAAGAGIGGLWAAGILSGMLPAIGPAIAGGILGSVLSSMAAGAAAGGIVGALAGLGFTDEDTKYYQTEFESGRILVTVRAGNRFDEATRIMESHGAYDVRSSYATSTPR